MIPQLPQHYRDGRPLEDERTALRWVIARLASPSRSVLSFPGMSEDLNVVLRATLPLLRMQIEYARAVHRLSGLSLSEVGYGVCRSMLEVRASLAYILGAAPNSGRAFGNQIWTMLVLQSAPGRPLRELTTTLALVKKADPVLFATISQRFAKRPFGHSSGMGWTALVKLHGGPDADRHYSFLSWHTHAIAATAAHVRHSRAGRQVASTYGPTRPEHLARRDVCTYATTFLTDTWLEFHTVFGPLGQRTTEHS